MPPLAHLQPDQSPYKFGLNSPINFIDPDGNTEWHFIKHLDKQGNITKLEIIKASDNVILARKSQVGRYKSLVNEYYDYVVYKTVRHTGSFGIIPQHTTTKSAPVALVDNGVRVSSEQWISDYDFGHIRPENYLDLTGSGGKTYLQAGGMTLVSSKGDGASPTRFTLGGEWPEWLTSEGNSEGTLNIDLLLNALGGFAFRNGTKYGKMEEAFLKGKGLDKWVDMAQEGYNKMPEDLANLKETFMNALKPKKVCNNCNEILQIDQSHNTLGEGFRDTIIIDGN